MSTCTPTLWGRLGWHSGIWEHGPNPPSDDKDWHELWPEEQAAALALGYTPHSWDSDDGNPFHSYQDEFYQGFKDLGMMFLFVVVIMSFTGTIRHRRSLEFKLEVRRCRLTSG